MITRQELYPGKTWPIWLMRQAGRVLPQYRALREQAPTFWELCSVPEKVVEITKQPLDELGVDAAILFSDILVPLACFDDISVRFVQKSQPQVRTALSWDQLSRSSAQIPVTGVPFVFESIRLLQAQITRPLIGFAGTPWTTSLYIQKHGQECSVPQMAEHALEQAPAFSQWLRRVTEVFAQYLIAQRQAGAQQLMLFDSWGALCPREMRQQWVIEPVRAIAAAIKKADPSCPIIYYGRGILPEVLPELSDQMDVFAACSSISLGMLQKQYPQAVFQGNIDAQLLLQDPKKISNGVKRWYDQLHDPVIVNLGAGLNPSTPLSHVKHLIATVRQITSGER